MSLLKIKVLGPISERLNTAFSLLSKEDHNRLLRVMRTDNEAAALDRVIGKNLKTIRKDYKVSQATMGSLLKVHQSAISRMEKGEQTISPIQIWVVETVFGVSYDELIQKDGFESPFSDDSDDS